MLRPTSIYKYIQHGIVFSQKEKMSNMFTIVYNFGLVKSVTLNWYFNIFLKIIK